jgi:hypothetical protein
MYRIVIAIYPPEEVSAIFKRDNKQSLLSISLLYLYSSLSTPPLAYLLTSKLLAERQGKQVGKCRVERGAVNELIVLPEKHTVLCLFCMCIEQSKRLEAEEDDTC